MNEVRRQVQTNIITHYPYSEKWEYTTRLLRINLDEECINDIRTGRGFIIQTTSSNIKKDVKGGTGIFSYQFGNILNNDSLNGAYSCRCGNLTGRLHLGERCSMCGTSVILVNNDVCKFGWLLLNEPYKIISPVCYMTLESFIGKSVLAQMLTYECTIDSNGNIIPREYDPKIQAKVQKEPFYGIGMIEFYNRFEEIMEYYRSKKVKDEGDAKSLQYKLIMSDYKNGIFFTKSIPVFSSLLRPSRLDNNSLKYEKTNEPYMQLVKNIRHLNANKTIKINSREKFIEEILKNIQDSYISIYIELKDILAKKKGDIRAAIGGRFDFSARCVITQDVSLHCNEIKLPYHCLCELLQQIIINYLQRLNGGSYAEAYMEWYKAQVDSEINKKIYNIIKDYIGSYMSEGGLPVLINRNPTINFGGIMFMRCIGITEEYVMNIPLCILPPLAADFDGDTLNIFYLYNRDFIEAAEKSISPMQMFISHDDGRCNMQLLPARDYIININAGKNISKYSQEELQEIFAVQNS